MSDVDGVCFKEKKEIFTTFGWSGLQHSFIDFKQNNTAKSKQTRMA